MNRPPAPWSAGGRWWPNRLARARRNRASDVVNGWWEWISALAMVGPEDARGRRFRHMGPGSGMAFPRGAIFGEEAITIGAQTLFSPYVTLSAGLPGEALGEGPALVSIGARCSIGRGCSIVGRAGIVIEDDVTIAPDVYITDHNHSYDDLDTPVGRQWPSEDPVRIGAGAWIGTGVIVLPGADIGRNVTVAGGSVVRGTVPDHTVVAGVPAHVVRRHDGSEWVPPMPARTFRYPPGWDGS